MNFHNHRVRLPLLVCFLCFPAIISFQWRTSSFTCQHLSARTADTDEEVACNGVKNDVFSPIERRDFTSLLSKIIIGSQVIAPKLSGAADDEIPHSALAAILKGVVTLKPGSEPISSELAALYVTAKPETTINAPKAIADAFAGRPPPVLTARFPISNGVDAFPFNFQFTESDITVEGAYQDATNEEKANKYWWTNDNLVVSARFDSDGVAATRDPDDLVGRTFSLVTKGDSSVTFRYENDVNIQLQGRGIGGKFITTKKENK